MIVSEIVEIGKVRDNVDVERELRARGIVPVRWAIIGVEPDKMKVSVSYCQSTQ